LVSCSGSSAELPRPAAANRVQVIFRNGSATAKVDVEYPVGRNRRCAEAIVGDTS